MEISGLAKLIKLGDSLGQMVSFCRKETVSLCRCAAF